MKRFSLIAALACTLVLSACGTASDNPLRASLFNNLKQLTTKKAPQQVLTTAILRARLTPELRAQIGSPVLIAELPKLKIAAVVFQVAQNGGATTWFAEDGVGFSTKSGLLLSTRGIGHDLMSSYVDQSLAMIKGHGKGVGAATRLHRFLDGEDQEVLYRFTCTYSRTKSHVLENCETKDLAIENQYWLDKTGEIWRSKQWAGLRNGYILLEKPAE